MTTTLRKSLGRIPRGYHVETPTNDWQVVINGPAGQSVITEINDGEDYEIETSLDRQGTRLYKNNATPREAMATLVKLNNMCLVMVGVAGTPSPRTKAGAVAAVLVGLVIVAALVAFLLTGIFDGDSDGPEPTAPVTWSPATTLETPTHLYPSPTPGATR